MALGYKQIKNQIVAVLQTVTELEAVYGKEKGTY